MARLNVLYPYHAEDVAEAQYVSLKEAAKQIDLERGRTLYDYSRTHAKGLGELFKRLNQSPTDEPWGVFLSVIETATVEEWRQAFRYHNSQLKPEDIASWREPVIELFGGAVPDRGPYIVLTEFVWDRAARRPYARAAYAHPVLSRKHLIPVDSEHERRTLRVAIEVQQALQRQTQVVCCIRKTLPGSAIHERGVGLQIQRMRPNGLPEFAWDLVTALGPIRTIERTTDAIYHFAEGGIESDEAFRVTLSQLLEPASRATHASPRVHHRAGEAGIPAVQIS